MEKGYKNLALRLEFLSLWVAKRCEGRQKGADQQSHLGGDKCGGLHHCPLPSGDAN